MKKIYFLLMLAALSATAVLHAAEAGEDDYTTLSFTCSLESTLSAQMKSEMIEQVESLTVAGVLREEDVKTIDKCCRLKWLDLTNASRNERDEEGYAYILKDDFIHTAIETLFLPRNTVVFALQGLSFFRWDRDCGRPAADEGMAYYDGQPHFEKTISVYVTERFPVLASGEPIDGYYGCPMEFHLAEGNDMYIEEDGVIYTKDKSTLLKVNQLYGKTAEECTFDVEQIDRHAFTYALWDADSQVITFSKRLKKVRARAFTYPAVPYEPKQEGEETKSTGAIRLQGWTPPFCEFVDAKRQEYAGVPRYWDQQIDDKYFTPCKIIVPSKVRYFAAQRDWEPFVIDDYDYGLLCGTMTPDDKEEFYSKLDPYAPRIEEVSKIIAQGEVNYNWSAGAGFVFGGHDEEQDEYHARLVVHITCKGSAPLTFVNPESGKEEKVNIKYGWRDDMDMEDFIWQVVGYDTEGNELFVGSAHHDQSYDLSFSKAWPEATTMDVIDSWEEGGGTTISPVPNGSVAIRLKGTGKFGITGDLGEGEKKDLYFIAGYLTGVKPTELQHAEDTPYYDLQGRQVAQPARGLYIHNGKKYLQR